MIDVIFYVLLDNLSKNIPDLGVSNSLLSFLKTKIK